MLRGDPLTIRVTHMQALALLPCFNNAPPRNLGSGQPTKALVCSIETSAYFKVFLFVYLYFICYVIFDICEVDSELGATAQVDHSFS